MFLLRTPFEGVTVGFSDNDTFGWSDRWNNIPYIKDFNNNKYVISSYRGNFNEKLTEQERAIYQQALEYVIDEHNYDPYDAIVYSIEVADYHTYFVENSGFWVHDASLNNQPYQ